MRKALLFSALGILLTLLILIAGASAATEGLIVQNQGIAIVSVWQGAVVGEIEVLEGLSTDELQLLWLDQDSIPSQPGGVGDSLKGTIADSQLAELSKTGPYTFTIASIDEHGQTTITFTQYLGGVAGYVSPSIELHIEPVHAEANGLLLFEDGIAIVQVWESTVIGGIEIHHTESTAEIGVYFLDTDSVLFQPVPPDFTLKDSIVNPLIAAFNSTGDWTFTISGLEEGTTDLFLSIFHDGHPDYESPPIAVHVEEAHADANGLLVFRQGESPGNGSPVVQVWEAAVMGQIDAVASGSTPALDVFFLDADSTAFQPNDPEFWLVSWTGAPSIATTDSLGQFRLRVNGVTAGTTNLVMQIIHEDHTDYTSPDIPVSVSACVCACHADPTCDGDIDVLDVVGVVNVAFRGIPATNDSDCHKQRTDVDCSHATDILDVVLMVNVAFRGVDASTAFCKPCAP